MGAIWARLFFTHIALVAIHPGVSAMIKTAFRLQHVYIRALDNIHIIL